MPYDDPDPTDPSMLVGVMLPAEPETMTDMAYVFAEEFARLGYDRAHLLRLFKDPFYAGAHGAYKALGEEAVRAIIDECLAAWGGIRFTTADFGREPQSNDPGYSIDEKSEQSEIHNPKSKMDDRGGSDAEGL